MKITQPMITAFLIGLIAGAVVIGFVNSYSHKVLSGPNQTISEDSEDLKKANSIKQR